MSLDLLYHLFFVPSSSDQKLKRLRAMLSARSLKRPMLHTLSFDEVSSPDVNLKGSALPADPKNLLSCLRQMSAPGPWERRVASGNPHMVGAQTTISRCFADSGAEKYDFGKSTARKGSKTTKMALEGCPKGGKATRMEQKGVRRVPKGRQMLPKGRQM